MEVLDVYLCFYFYDMCGVGFVNVVVVVEVGIDVIDVSCGGIGGCLFVFVVIGNVVIEDVVYMLEWVGFEIGFDFGKLIEIVKWLEIVFGYLVSFSFSKVGGFLV